MRRLAICSLIATGLLSGCGGAPSTAPAATPGGTPPTAETAAPNAKSETVLPSKIEGSGDLKGLSATQIGAALGPPDFRRRDPPAEIWQYRASKCTLDLFIYEDAVTHADVRSPPGLPEKACLDEIIGRR